MQINNEITIRSIQHYLYCAHRWGLIEIGNVWAENYFVTKANLMHENVHAKNAYTKRGAKVFSSVPVYNDEYNIYGVVDCIEATVSENGVQIAGEDKKYNLSIVEYKPTKPKNDDFHYEDAMQMFAQKICVDSVFNCDCKCILYYADVKKRVELPIKENYEIYYEELKSILSQMQEYLKYGIIPHIKRGQYCGGCSLKDVCMPLKKHLKSIRRQIEEMRDIE